MAGKPRARGTDGERSVNGKSYAELHGRKSQDPDEDEKKRRHRIKVMVSTDTPLSAIAELAGIPLRTLKVQYQAELHRGWEYVYALISEKLVEAALSGDRQSQLLWLRHRGGWQDVTRKELSGPGGGPISVRTLDTAILSQVVDALTAKGSAGGGKGRAGPKVIDVEPDLDTASGSSDESFE